MAGAVKRFAVAVAVALAGMSSAWAQDSNQELKKEVDTLKAKVAALEAENPNAAKAGLPVSVSADAPPAEEKSGNLAGINEWVKDVSLSAFVDAGYVYNFNRPGTGSNAVRAFDNNANNFYLHMAQVMFDKSVSDKSIVGGRIKMAMGSDADAIASNGPGAGSDNFDIEEGYVQILAPVGKGITFTAGKFVTLAGSEVIESKDNLNYSRGLLFTWAIPFTHTGIRAAYSPIDQLDLLIGINNGWDKMQDNNSGKTLELQAVLKPIENWKFFLNMYYGAEKDTNGVAPATPGSSPGDKRFLLDFVVSGTIDKLTLGFNWDWAMEDNSAANGDDGHWTGAAAYVKYQLDPKYAPGLRVEYFRDSDGIRTGLKQTLVDVTFTNQFDVIENVILRFELRYDKSSEDIFFKNSDLKGNQLTAGFEVIWMFK